MRWSVAGLVASVAFFPWHLRAQDGSDPVLRVLRHTPGGGATPGPHVTVTFDRPVAGALDRSVNASKIFRIQPALAGTVAWRDPVTIRFLPDKPLAPGSRFAVTIDTTFRAIDGSRLVAPYRFTFRVPGPALLARSPWHVHGDPLGPNEKVYVLYSAPVDLRELGRVTRLELECAGRTRVRLLPLSQRPVRPEDPYAFQVAGDWDRDTTGDRFRRVVELAPASTIPGDCEGWLVVPDTLGGGAAAGEDRFRVATRPGFRLTRVDCPSDPTCALEQLHVQFTTPVRRADVLRYVRIDPRTPFTLTAGPDHLSTSWMLQASLAPRTRYTVVVDTALRDAFGRALDGRSTWTLVTADLAPAVAYGTGLTTIPARGPRALPLRHVNVDTVAITMYPVPDAARAGALAMDPRWSDLGRMLPTRDSVVVRRALRGTFNEERTTLIPVDELAGQLGGARLFAIRFDVVAATPPPDGVPTEASAWNVPPPVVGGRSTEPLALVQLTDVAAHAKVTPSGAGTVLVTGLTDGHPRAGARVTLFDHENAAIARGTTSEAGLAVLTAIPGARITERRVGDGGGSRVRYVEVSLGGDRSVTPLDAGRSSGYYHLDPLDPERVGGRPGYDAEVTGAVFTDRGIYRPGERVYAKAIVRTGPLGDLRAPGRGDSLRWVIRHLGDHPESGDAAVRDTVVALSEFGTAVDSFNLRRTLPLGMYAAELRVGTGFSWRTVAHGEFRLAEYRPPEFLVAATIDDVPRFALDTAMVRVEARYLFGAPMASARARWALVTTELDASELNIPNTEGWAIGGSWWEWSHTPRGSREHGSAGEATLDSAGRLTLPVAQRDTTLTRPARVNVSVAVADVNRQVVTASAGVIVHPADLYVAARHAKGSWVWASGVPQRIDVRTVRPDGRVAPGVPLRIAVLHRRWVYESGSESGPARGWRNVTDTVATDTMTAGARPSTYTFTPRAPGEYHVRIMGRDERGRPATTTVGGYVVGADRPWPSLDSPYRLAVVPSRERLVPGDTATVTFDVPFERAEAWVTVERERILEERRLSVRRGLTTLHVPLTERHAPNAFVSVVLVKTPTGEASAPDSAPQVLRAGYAELRVDPGPKRLTVGVTPLRTQYGPRDTAGVRLRVRDARGRGVRSEIALWAVDEGVLALTGFATPDPVGAIYHGRGVGSRLRSTLSSVVNDPSRLRVALRVAAQRAAARRAAARRAAAARGRSERAIPTSDSMNAIRVDTVTVQQLAVYPSTGMELPVQDIPAAVLRTEFRTTAFFLGAVVTDDSGAAVAHARLPDNVTTYRVIAVAVGEGDRYGTGVATLLATRPLVARPALPRFVRPGDSFVAGPVVNARDGTARTVRVDAQAAGVSLRGPSLQSLALEAGRGAEARFAFQVPARDSGREIAVFRFGVTGDANRPVERDAVETRLEVRPDFRRRAHTAIGVVRDAASVEFRLPADIDPARSRLTLRLGTSPLAPMLTAYERLSVYPYYCTEQLSSGGRVLVALYRATRTAGSSMPALGRDPLGRLQQLADELALRQRDDGAIGFWHRTDWSSPWLSTYAGLFLLDARAAGVTVEQRVIDRLATYLAAFAEDSLPRGGVNRSERIARRLALGERVAAVDFLRRAGKAGAAVEERLLARARDMQWEDRLWLAEVLASRRDVAPGVRAILDDAWRDVGVAGGRVDLPDSLFTRRDFPSRTRPAARLLTATLAIRPDHPLVAALVETVLQQGRAEGGWAWNTQDYAAAVTALARLESEDAQASARRVIVAGGGRTLIDRVVAPRASGVQLAGSEIGDSVVALTGLVRRDRSGAVTLPLRVAVTEGEGRMFYALTVEEVPSRPPVTPDAEGIAVERWYERFDTGQPVTSVEEGDLVRVRLRVTVPSDRQFVVVDDALPAGLEPVDLTLRTSATLGPFATAASEAAEHYADRDRDGPHWQAWRYGSWDNGWWSPWDHKEIRDDRVVYFARALWKGTYAASYVARATTQGTFVRPPAHAEEMYNPALHGRSDGGVFEVRGKAGR